jgi:hypothetical protein
MAPTSVERASSAPSSTRPRLDGAQLDKAYANLKTAWPPGFDAPEEGVIVLGVDDPAETVHDDLD